MCNFLFQNNDSLDELLKSFLMDELEPGTGDQSSEGERGAWEGGILDQCQGDIGFNPMGDVSAQDLDPSKSILDQICGEFFIREAGRCNFLI